MIEILVSNIAPEERMQSISFRLENQSTPVFLLCRGHTQSNASVARTVRAAVSSEIMPWIMFLGAVFYNHGHYPRFQSDQFHPPRLTDLYPSCCRWQTWYHLSHSGPLSPLPKASRKGWNIRHQLGGNGPWFEATGRNRLLRHLTDAQLSVHDGDIGPFNGTQDFVRPEQ